MGDIEFQHVKNSIRSVDGVSSVEESAQVVVAGLLVELKESAALKVENAHYTGSARNGAFDEIPGRAYNEIRAGFVIGF